MLRDATDRPETHARRRAVCRVATFALALMGLATIHLHGQTHPSEPHRHLEAEKLEPAVPSTPESLAAGRALYEKLCASCHGPYGLGNGRLAAGIAAYGPWPSNLTDDEWQHGSSAGEVFVVIRDGIEPDFHMPAFGDTLAVNDLWNLTHYVRSLSH
jgi:mono/diheme cytochrome c family protein